MSTEKIKNSLKIGSDKDGYFGEYGGIAAGENLMNNLEELKKAFEAAIKDKKFLDEFAYYCKHWIGRPSPIYFAERITNKIGGAKIYFKQEHLNHTGSHKPTNTLFQVLLAKRMGKKKIICESGAGQHWSAAAANAAKFGMPIVGVMGKIDCARVNQNLIKAKHYGGKLKIVEGSLREAITAAIKEWSNNPDYYYLIGSTCSSSPFVDIVRYAQSIIGKEMREQFMELEGKLPNEIIACAGAGSNFTGSIFEFLDEPEIKKVVVEAEETAALTNGTKGIQQGMVTKFLQSDDGSKSLGGSSLGAGIMYYGISPQLAHLKDIGAIEASTASDKELLETYKLVAQNEGIGISFEPAAAVTEALKRAKGKPKDYIICATACGRVEKDLDVIERLIGKDFE